MTTLQSGLAPEAQAVASPAEVRRQWLAVFALAMAAFVFNTTEFVPVGLLSDIGASFGMPTERTGLMLTIYAWVVALTSLPFMLLTRQVERRHLLMGVLLLFVASHVLSGLAWSFGSLMAGRLGVAAAHAVFWSITASLAVRVAPAGKQAQALGLLATGTSLAMVLGIPIGRVVGQWLGWRMTFWLIGLVALLVMVGLRAWLPRLPAENVGSLKSLPLLMRRPALLALYLLTAVVVTGQFTAYSFIEPFLQDVFGHSAHTTTTVLLLFGGSGVLGSVLFSRWGLRFPRGFLLGAIGALTVCLLALHPAAAQQALLYPVVAVWGVSMIAFALAMQACVLRQARDATDVAMSLFSGIFNIGIGGGALLGSQVGTHGHLGWVAPVGGAVGVMALLWCAFAVWRWRAAFQVVK